MKLKIGDRVINIITKESGTIVAIENGYIQFRNNLGKIHFASEKCFVLEWIYWSPGYQALIEVLVFVWILAP